MADKAKGVVKFLEKNDFGFWNFKIGNDRFGTGSKEEPEFENGNLVEFSYYLKNDKYKTVKGEVKVVKKSSTASTGSGGSKVDYWDAKGIREVNEIEPRITYLAAHERAVHVVQLAIAQGAYPSLEKVKPVDRLEHLRALIEAEAEVIFNGAYSAKLPKSTKAAIDDRADGEEEAGDDEDESEEGEGWDK